MKNNLIKFSVLLVLLVSAPSCNKFLDVVPSNIAVIEDAFSTRDAAERFLATLYGYLPEYSSIAYPANLGGDEMIVNINVSRNWDARRLSIGGQNANQPLLGYWGNENTNSNMFIALRDCNIFLENISLPFDLEDFEERRWTAEVKALKAYYHFFLMRMYGPIPIVRENIEVSEGVDAVRVSRDPIDEVTDYIVELIDEALPDLPSVIVDLDELGRLTAPAAAAIKARALVLAASPLFNGNTDYASFTNKDGEVLISQTADDAKWTRAAEACKEAIDIAEAAGHQLYEFTDEPTWSDSTNTKMSIRASITDRWNDEVIWGASYSGGSRVATFQNWGQAKIAAGLPAQSRESVQSWLAATFRMAELFYSENGVPIEEDPSYNFADRYEVAVADADHRYHIDTGFETVRLNMNREPRFYASLGFDGGIWEGHGVDDDTNFLFPRAKNGEQAGKQDSDRWSLTGYWPKKLVHYENVQSVTGSSYSNRAYPFPVVRLADLYLLYAEALNEASGPAQAYPWIDRIRTRAGLNGVVASWAASSNNPSKPTTKEGFRDIIQQERMIELAFEGQRFWDLRRWKRAAQLLNSDIRAWNTGTETTVDYYRVITAGKYQFLRRDYLWPIAENDIIRNSNLVQNPGW